MGRALFEIMRHALTLQKEALLTKGANHAK